MARFTYEQDIQYMQIALEEARKAYENDEVPIGAIVVDMHGNIIGRGRNTVEKHQTQNAHAEVNALVYATETIQDWRLNNCWLYVTLQPCDMCMGLIALSRLEGVVYGASSPLFGYQLDNEQDVHIYKIGIPKIKSGVCNQEAAVLLKNFFKQKRKKG